MIWSLLFAYWVIGVIPALWCLTQDRRYIVAHYGPIGLRTMMFYYVFAATITALAWPFELRIYRRKIIRLYRATIMPKLFRERSEERYRRHVCPACSGKVYDLPSAPGWYDALRCDPCRIDWDNAHPMGRIRGVEK